LRARPRAGRPRLAAGRLQSPRNARRSRGTTLAAGGGEEEQRLFSTLKEIQEMNRARALIIATAALAATAAAEQIARANPLFSSGTACTVEPTATGVSYNQWGIHNESTTAVQTVWCSLPASTTPAGPIAIYLYNRNKNTASGCMVHGMNGLGQEVWSNWQQTGGYQEAPYNLVTPTPPGSVYFFTLQCFIAPKELNPNPGASTISTVFGTVY